MIPNYHLLTLPLTTLFYHKQCLAEPLKPQYGGGIINAGLRGWSNSGLSADTTRASASGNTFAVVRSRRKPYQSVSQKVYLHKEKLYTLSAWVRIDEGNAVVGAVFKTAGDGFVHAGLVEAKSGCWSMLKGGLTVKTSGPADLYFESKNTTVEIWVDSVSLQPFTQEQWRAHQEESINKVRKKMVRIQAIDAKGNTIPGANISIQQTRPGFPFGSSTNENIINNTAYQNYFASRFTVTTFENEMKWYATEHMPGKEDYSKADAMLAFAKKHNIPVRAHNIFWDNAKIQMPWVHSLSRTQLWYATSKRINSVMSRYKGQVIAWDVVNENLHFSFFEDKLGTDASNVFYQEAHELDTDTMMFLNEFNTLEWPEDQFASPSKYLQKLREIQSYPGNRANMAIGLESHFGVPNIPFVRSALDVLANAKVPIWLTEVDAANDTDQPKYLEAILREAYAHPAVQGIVMWTGWRPGPCEKMCLTDSNFKNTAAGNVVDKLIAEWKTGRAVGSTDKNGYFETQLFHGDYDILLSHPSVNSSLHSLKVDSGTRYAFEMNACCLAEPLKPQYGGGIIRNPEFNAGLRGWSNFGFSTDATRASASGNTFAVVRSRRKPYQTWVRIDEGNAVVGAVFKTAGDGFVHAALVEAKSGCWSMLKGGLTVKTSGPAEVYFESKNTTVEIWVDSVSLQPFTEEQWRAHQEESINKVRKKTVRIQAIDAKGNTIPGANIAIQQTRSGFPFGSSTNENIINNAAYQNYFASRFTVTTFENEMKWYDTEYMPGKEDYSKADAMLAFIKKHNILVRAHNIFWDDPKYQMGWVNSLNKTQLWTATWNRINSIMSRYKGQVIAWDVVNENLHFSYFEDKLGTDASKVFYQEAHKLDADTMMFLNEYNTLEVPQDWVASPSNYLQKLREIQSYPGNSANMAIGLESHFGVPDIPFMRSALDVLANAKVPIWLTEVDCANDANQPKYLEAILREAYAHPAVQGIVMWTGWHPGPCDKMCLTDSNFKNTPAGNVVDKLIAEWKTRQAVGSTDKNGYFETQLFHGDYDIIISHPSVNSSLQSLKVDSGTRYEYMIQIQEISI
uniref:GH10 domain-containing protein n=1 Tax=Ananas comosus var. bracteatus TaxID=296719 RepID=A0A6V7Q4I6_ANACO|nr:unnamed protein product [Ananas comosus var. bracteatus]